MQNYAATFLLIVSFIDLLKSIFSDDIENYIQFVVKWGNIFGVGKRGFLVHVQIYLFFNLF